MTSPLIETEELSQIVDDPDVVILDSSWHLPTMGRDGKAEYLKEHIAGARFFDIDAISDQQSTLPHMLPSIDVFETAMNELGITNDTKIIVYDSVGITSSPRCWWTLRVFGHDNVYVLNGGLVKWKAEGRPVTDAQESFDPSSFHANFQKEMLADRQLLEQNLENKTFTVLDARSHGRFTAQDPEPRPGLAGGHIPHSLSLPFVELLDGGSMKPADEIRNLLTNNGITSSTPVITTCGSGVTASVISLALEVAEMGVHKLYDGSWSEWGGLPDTPKQTG
jgi:thiosulfate/3-mercaptopyruvate sulfurtransferase